MSHLDGWGEKEDMYGTYQKYLPKLFDKFIRSIGTQRKP